MKFDDISFGTVYQCEKPRNKKILYYGIPLMFEDQTERLVVFKLSGFRQEGGCVTNIDTNHLNADMFSILHPNLLRTTVYFANGPLKVRLETMLKMQTFYIRYVLDSLMNGIGREHISFGDMEANPMHIMLISEIYSNLKALHETTTGGKIINRDLDVYRHCIYGAYIGALDRNKKSRVRHHVLVWEKRPDSRGYFVFPLIANNGQRQSETIIQISVNRQKMFIDITLGLTISESRFSYPLYDHINKKIAVSISQVEIRSINAAIVAKFEKMV